MLQLNPPIPVETPRGQALAHGWIDYGPEYSILWICIGDDGQCWAWPNDKIRGVKNITMGRMGQNRELTMAGDKDDRKSSKRPGIKASAVENRKNTLPERDIASRRAKANRKMHEPKRGY